MDRPKRNAAKPQRYQTTSSDEAPQTTSTNRVHADIEEDVEDIRRILENNETEYNSVINAPLHINTDMRSQLHTHSQLHTPLQSPIHSQPHTLSQPHTHSQTHTHSQPHMHSQQQMHSQSHSHSQPLIHSQPHMHSQSQIHSQPHMDSLEHTHVQVHVDSQPHLHSQAYTQSQPHTHWQPYAQHQLPVSYNTAHIADTNVNLEWRRLESRMEKIDNEQIGNRRILERMEADNKKIFSLLQNVAKCVQHTHSALRKPASLPITSTVEMEAFEDLNENEYSNIVQYLCNIGGFNVKEAISLCLKESIIDSVTLSFTWWGYKGSKSFYNTRLVMAIFDAVCKNQYFVKPSRQEFQQHMKEALRAAKERVRSKSRGLRISARKENVQHDFWNDKPDEDEDFTDEN